MYDHTDQRFVSVSLDRMEELWTETSAQDVPPLHQALLPTSSGSLTLTVYLNKKRPLSEPKWCRTSQADEWLCEQFGSKKGSNDQGWRGKLEIMDPDPVRMSWNHKYHSDHVLASDAANDSGFLGFCITQRSRIRQTELYEISAVRFK